MKRLLACVLLAAGCAKTLPPAFVAEKTAAERAYAKGDYRGAARAWARTAERAPDARERDEAVYRQATSLERAGDARAADALYSALARGTGERAERASFEIAGNALARGESERGYALLLQAIFRFPNSGLARRAVGDILDERARLAGERSAIAEAAQLAERLRGTEVEEALRYEHARRLESDSQIAPARDVYLELARRFPYPEGAYWDEALFRAAECERRLRRVQRALDLLERLLAERETARGGGSYERPLYAEARFRRAEIFRDELGDYASARREFTRVWVDHPTSRLSDDALFEVALIGRRAKDEAGACRAAKELVKRWPESRFARCGGEVCAGMAAGGRECPEGVRRRVGGR